MPDAPRRCERVKTPVFPQPPSRADQAGRAAQRSTGSRYALGRSSSLAKEHRRSVRARTRTGADGRGRAHRSQHGTVPAPAQKSSIKFWFTLTQGKGGGMVLIPFSAIAAAAILSTCHIVGFSRKPRRLSRSSHHSCRSRRRVAAQHRISSRKTQCGDRNPLPAAATTATASPTTSANPSSCRDEEARGGPVEALPPSLRLLGASRPRPTRVRRPLQPRRVLDKFWVYDFNNRPDSPRLASFERVLPLEDVPMFQLWDPLAPL